MEPVVFATVGATVGVALFHIKGGAGLAIWGTAYPIGLVAFGVTGAVVGLAACSVKKTVLG